MSFKIHRLSCGILAVSAGLTLSGLSVSAEDDLNIWVSYTGNTLANLSGGTEKGTSYTHELDIGTSFEFDQNWSFVLTGAWTQGKALSEKYIGDIGGLQGTYNDADALWLYEAYVNYSRDNLDVAFGRMSAGDTFASLDSMGNFINATFASNAGAISTNAGGFTTSPTSTWGVKAEWQTSDSVTWKLGAYTSDQDSFDSDDHGVDFSFNPSNGLLFAAEVQYAVDDKTSLGGGVYYDTAEVETFAGTMEDGNVGFYSYVETELSDKLSSMLMVQIAPEASKNIFPVFVMGSLHWSGLIAGRDDDLLSLGVGHGFASDESGLSRNETIFEANYTASISGNAFIQPAIQYVVNPGGKVKNAFVVGAQFGFEF